MVPLKALPSQATLHQAMWEYRRGLIMQRLKECGMNVSTCARSFNVHRNTLVRLIQVSNINIEQMRRQWRLAGVWIENK